MSKLKLIELFAGVGSQAMALRNLGIEYEAIGISEIDKYAIQSYEAIHGKTRNFGDISKIEELPYCDLLTYSFPCIDISVIGEQKGIKKDTSSGLLLQVKRLLLKAKENGTLPKYLLLENVKNLVGKKFIKDFEKWLSFLNSLGYYSNWEVLNAKDYGVPQNRERVFVVSSLKSISYKFPKKQELEIQMKDLLEKTIDDKYYLSDKLLKCFLDMKNRNGFIRGTRFKPHVKGNEKIAFTLTSAVGSKVTDNYISDVPKEQIEIGKTKIRRITPLESWRLMGFSDEDFYKAKNSGVSNTQLYRQAGNSIVVPVLEGIFRNLLLKKHQKRQTIVAEQLQMFV